MKLAISVLTKGYNDISEYSNLIKRNKHIESNLNDLTIDILIFHEGNIEDEHQKYISEQTSALNIKFINISDKAFKKEKEHIIYEYAGHSHNIGYRHMCSFWFVDFWKYVEEYDYLLRIDEDCFIFSNIDYIFSQLSIYFLVSGVYQSDLDFVTVGLNKFTLDFINKNSDNYEFKKKEETPPGGPYTNLFGISLIELRKNNMLFKYIEEIELSDMIYKRRWGDLPLWGDAIAYIIGNDKLYFDKNLKYYHLSHDCHVNEK